jgi:tripartite-type tricarboxylate transporter receptor subunit TctC
MSNVLFRAAAVTAIATLVSATALAPRAVAQSGPVTTYPQHTIKLVVGSTAAGGVDTLARILAANLAAPLGQSLIVENRPGAGQNIGSAFVAHSAPDGYTLLVTSSSFAVNVNLYPDINYDPIKDFVPIALIAQSPNLLVVRPSLPVNTLEEFIAYGKRQKSPLTYSSSGVGNTQHLATELFKLKTGMDATHIPYSGSAPSLMALLSESTDFTFINISTVKGEVLSGKVRPLAITSNARSPLFPNVPTMQQAGLSGMDVSAWYGVLAPAGTPPAIVTKLNKAIDDVLSNPAAVKRLDALGMDPITETPDYFSTFLKQDMERWKTTIDRAHIKGQ